MFFFFLGLFQGFFCLFFLVGRIFSFLMSSPESYKRRYYQVGSNEPSYSLDGNEDDGLSTLPSRTDDPEIFLLKCKFLALTFALMFLMAVVVAGGLAFMVVLVSTKDQYDTVSSPTYNFTEERYLLPTRDGTKIAITIFKPIEKVGSVFAELYPVILEVVGTRKDDIEYLQSYPYQVYFARRGYVFVSMDNRGTGSSWGSIGDNLHTQTEISDVELVLEYITAQDWSSGKVGLFGRGRGAETAIIAAKRMNPENKTLALNHIDCLYVMNPSDDFYYGGGSYMDGGLHLDEILIKLDHLTGIPASPNYALDDDYFTQRVKQTPWVAQHLRNQQNSSYWNNDSLSRENLMVPIYFVGGEMYPFVDYAIDIASETTHLLPFYKLVIGPWNNTWAFQSRTTPTYDDMHESVRWFDTYLLNKFNQLSEENQVEFYVRTSPSIPTEQDTDVPGTWKSVPTLPIPTHQATYYLCRGLVLSSVPCALTGGSPNFSLKYEAGVGAPMNRWWGDLKGDMQELDKESLCFSSSALSSNISIAGQIKVNFKIKNDANISTVMVRVEEVVKGKAETSHSNYVSGRSVSLNQYVGSAEDPANLEDEGYYSISVHLRFVAYNFKQDNRIRVCFTNTLFPMYWPGPDSPSCNIVYDDASSFISLPELKEASSAPSFTSYAWNSTEDGVTAPDGWRYEAGGWPRNFMKEETDPSTTPATTTYTYDSYINLNNTLIATYLGYSLTQPPPPSFPSSSFPITKYVGYGASVYIFGVTDSFLPDSEVCHTTNRTGLDSILFLQSVPNNFDSFFPSVENPINLECSDLPDFDMLGMDFFQVLTSVEVTSDMDDFTVSFSRAVYGTNLSQPLFEYNHEETIPRSFH